MFLLLLSLYFFLSPQIIEHIQAISIEHYFIGTEAWMGLNQDPAAQFLLVQIKSQDNTHHWAENIEERAPL